jgi:hypothetical protein
MKSWCSGVRSPGPSPTGPTGLYSLFFLGARTLESFRQFGILPAFTGVVVSDHYQNVRGA